VIVYGDTVAQISVSDATASLRARVRRALRTEWPGVDALRAILIRAGELEQAVLDARPALDPALAAKARALTARSAEAFAHAWFHENEPASANGSPRAALRALAAVLDGCARASSAVLSVHTPEGFAHYALYPEQYIEAALLWAADHAHDNEREVLVVGVRSIGTTLAALMGSVLRMRGFDARTTTLRPSGHPFARRARLEDTSIGRARLALVVDEGPGLSGSSMVAAAEALIAAGMPRTAISFAPGHAGAPGPAALPAIRAFWSSTPRYSVPLARVRICGRVVPEMLAAVLPELYGAAASVVSIEDLSCGAWRGAVYAERERWPAVCTPFERTKLRCTTRGGAKYLFKFAGLCCATDGEGSASEAHAAVLKQRAELGWSPRPVAIVHGFVATRWVDAEPLMAHDADATVLARLGRYIAQSAAGRLHEHEHASALERLESLVSTNACEALGGTAGHRVCEAFVRGVRAERGGAAAPRAYGDGHLAPHEWLRSGSGDLIKVDSTGHADDHTIVGKQSIAWDIAGAAVEWKLAPAALERVLTSYRAAGGEALSAAQLTAYRLAYAAFRAGQFRLCADMCTDELERAGLQRAFGDYCAELCRVL
jgi:hypothetical protein